MRDCFDEKLATALLDVPVPEGLAQRLLERLDKEEPAVRGEEATPGRHRWVLSRSSFLVLGLSLAASVLVAVWLGMHRGEAVSPQFALDEAIRWFDAGTDQRGTLLAERPAPADYPFSQAVFQVRAVRWRPVDGFLDRQGVIYDLPGPAGTAASLYVVEAETATEFDAAPAVYPFTTAGCCASAWREGRLLYVLVVQGNPATYRAYLNLPRGPVA